ncbi:MAG: hypothetical protein JO331_14080 [Verrucomicrobia bacterium]|nr:hypothetical protein [Verrucomicrobiota bacterium]
MPTTTSPVHARQSWTPRGGFVQRPFGNMPRTVRPIASLTRSPVLAISPISVAKVRGRKNGHTVGGEALQIARNAVTLRRISATDFA